MRPNKEEIKAENRVRERKVVGRIYGTKYNERAARTDIDAKSRTESDVGKLGWFMSKDINRNIPTT